MMFTDPHLLLDAFYVTGTCFNSEYNISTIDNTLRL